MATKGKGGPSLEDAGGSRSRLGLWLITSRIRQLRAFRVAMKTGKETESNLDSFGPNSSSSRPNSPWQQSSSPGSPHDLDGWQKSSKVAHHHSSAKWPEEPT